ncbi:MAG TPA: error-prone DNA polymerase [Vicinamibacterales bacterium]|nr:error-prone DNA polymerase [Vicinamibacterales bacterium]
MYIELHTASAFSFLDGASLPEALVDRAAEHGYPALALLDRDGLYGAPRFHKAATAAGIRPIVGAELTIASGQWPVDSGQRDKKTGDSGERAAGSRQPPAAGWSLPVLVASREGYQNLCRLVTRMKMRAPKGEGALALEDLDGATRGLVALVGREALCGSRHGVGGLVDRLVGLFGRDSLYVELQRHLQRRQEADQQALRDLAAAFHVPLLATNGVRFAAPGDRPLYDVLTCIRHKTTLEAAGRRLSPNAERYLKSPAEMAALFADVPEAVANTEALADRLRYTLSDLGYRFPEYPVPPGEDMASFLRKMTDVGARDRYRPYHDRARAQVARELALIERLGLAGYFLIVWDIVNFCRQQGILAQGRGSAANSAVCYSLGITAVDPVGMDLLFERFLSEERGEWPDIDLDLPSGERRERVIQHVYEKYGEHGAAMTANVITYRGRSAAREVGKVVGLDAATIDRLSKVIHRFEFKDDGETIAGHLGEIGLDPTDHRMRVFAGLWRRIQDVPRHLGQHSGGMVICQGRLDGVVPLENASMPGRVVVQWDKDDCADMGIVKIDLLGLGMMAVLQDSLGLINDRRPASAPELGLWNMPPDDPEVYRLLQAADTIGVFQVESRAQMATLPRLKPERFYDLVVEVAIIRPGPIVGQMVHPYLNRRAGREPVVYPHPSLEPILARTLGVPLFQEQLLRIAMVAAGFTGGQAEELRRAFGFKRSERRMQQIEGQLREGMARKGITGQAAEGIITAISSFALYGFPESHSASFALLVYASAYLKAHYPAAFYAALLNNQPMGFYHPATLVKDAQRRGVHFAPVDVQRSDWFCTIEENGVVRLGLCYVKGLRRQVGEAMQAAPAGRGFSPGSRPVTPGGIKCPKCGCDDQSMLEVSGEGGRLACFCNTCAHDWTVMPPRFGSLDELIARTGLNREELSTLAEIGALGSLGFSRREALWQVERAVRPAGDLCQDSELEGASPLPEMAPVERLVADYEGTGMTIGPHPMAMRREEMNLRGALRAIDLAKQRHGRRVRVAGAVITRQRPGTAKGFVFLTLEDETGIANIIVRPDLFGRDRLTILGEPFLLVEGILQNQEGVVSVRADRMDGLGGGRVRVGSRDFY